MKKLLLLISSAALSFSPMLAQTDADPVFPESFKVTTSCELNVEQGDAYGFTIEVTGQCPDDTYTITVEVPEGWDGFLCGSTNEFNPDVEPLKRLGAYTPQEPTWMTIEEACSLMQFYGLPLRKGNSLTFSVEEEEHMGALFLYKGDMVDFTNGISINTNVTKKEAEPEPEPKPEPVFPESFNVTTSCELNVEQGDDYGFTIEVTGQCPDDTYTITVEVPEGWDGFLCGSTNEFNPDVEPLKRLGAYTPQEPTWMTIEEACSLMQFYGLPLRKGNSLTFSVEEEEHMGALFLYKGNMVDFTNGISINTNVTKKEADPVFPESFNVTTSCELNVEQGEDWGAYTIMVSGECPDDDYSITLGLPEGWDGFVCISYEELNVNPLKKLGSYTPYETMWVEIEEFMTLSAYMGGTVTKSNTITFSSESDEPTGAFYLYKNGMVDAGNGIFVESYVTKKEAEPVFPDVIDVTANCETVTISQEFDEDIEAISIMATGTTTEDNVTLTFNLPEGWDGLIGGIMPIGIMNSRAESEWLPIEGFRQVMEELMNIEDIVQGTEFTFPADGTVQMYQFYPYVGDMVDVANGFLVTIMVEKDTPSGIKSIEAVESNARYFNLQGAEVESPKAGIYVKVANGKASKVLVK